MFTARDAHYAECVVKDILSEPSVRLPIINQHLLHDLLCRETAKAARLSPDLIDSAIPGHPIRWQ